MNLRTKIKQKGFLILQGVLALAVLGAFALGTTAIFSGAFKSMDAAAAGMEVQRVAEVEAQKLTNLPYADIQEKGIHARKSMQELGLSQNDKYQSEVTAGDTTTVSDGTELTVLQLDVYRGDASSPSFSLEIPKVSSAAALDDVIKNTEVVTQDVDKIKTDVTTINNSITTINQNVETINSKVDGNTANIATNTTNITNLTNQYNQLNQDIQKAQTDIQILDTTVKENKLLIDANAKGISDNKSSILTAITRIGKTETDIQNISKIITDEIRTNITNLQGSVKDLKTEADTNKNNISDLQTQTKNLDSRMKTVEGDTKALKESVNTLRSYFDSDTDKNTFFQTKLWASLQQKFVKNDSDKALSLKYDSANGRLQATYDGKNVPVASENSVGVPDYGNGMTIVEESSDNVHGIYLCSHWGIGRFISDTIDKKEKYWFFATSYTIPDIYEKYDTAEYYVACWSYLFKDEALKRFPNGKSCGFHVWLRRNGAMVKLAEMNVSLDKNASTTSGFVPVRQGDTILWGTYRDYNNVVPYNYAILFYPLAQEIVQ